MKHDHKGLVIYPVNAQAIGNPGHSGAVVGTYDPRAYYDDPIKDKSSLDFWTVLAIINRWKWLILATTFLGTLITTVLVMQITPLYKASVTFEIQKQETQILENMPVNPSTFADAEYMATQYALLKSRNLAERVVAKLDLTGNPEYADQSLNVEGRITAATDVVQRNINVIPVRRSRIARLEYTSVNPAETQRIANALAESFIASTLERKFEATSYAREFLKTRLATAKTTLETSERKVVDYAREQGILELNPGSGSASLDANSAVALNDALSEAQSGRIEAEQAFLEIKANSNNSEFSESETLQRLQTTRSELSGEYEELLAKFKPDYPKMTRMINRIDKLDEEITTEKQRLSNSTYFKAESKFNAAKAKERSLKRRVDQLKESLQDLRNRRIQYTILEREVDTARTQYDGLLQQLKKVTVLSGVGSSQISIVDRAVMPKYPFYPNKRNAIALSLLLSSVLGFALAWLLTVVDDTIKTPDDVKDKLGLPALGVMPKIIGGANLIVEQLEDPRSTMSEAFFSARTAIEFTSDTGSPKSILLTSTQPGEGKTSSIVALGSAFAKIGKRVLIIDADMRKPSFVSNSELSVGLSGILARDVDLMSNVLMSQTKRLFLLPTGITPPNPAELLSGAKIKRIIREAENNFDVVLVDSPPVLRFADAPILASICASTIVIIKSGKVRRPAVERTLGRLRQNHANIIGAFLMQFDAKKAGFEYSYYYYDYGQYGYSQGKANLSIDDERRKIDILSPSDLGH